MNIQELAKKYELTKDDFWEYRKDKWIITHDACEKIAVTEGIIFEPIQTISYIPTIITENGEKVQKVNKWGRESWQPAWAGTCQKKTGDVVLTIVGYKKDNPDYKIESNGEANATNCTSNYYYSMALKRAQDRVILKLIDAYQWGVSSEIEADDFEKHDKLATEKQRDTIHNMADELEIIIVGIERLTKEEASSTIDNLKEKQLTKKAEDKAKEKEYGV